jgi:hypothetical protein
MNVDTGHLVKGVVPEDFYEPVPRELQQEANKLLGDQTETYVNLSSNTNLSRWAAKKRKNKMKMAKQSRKRNR